MGERTEKRFIFLSQKLGRNTHLERSAGVLNEECSEEVIQITYIGGSFWVFVYLWLIILFLCVFLIFIFIIYFVALGLSCGRRAP